MLVVEFPRPESAKGRRDQPRAGEGEGKKEALTHVGGGGEGGGEEGGGGVVGGPPSLPSHPLQVKREREKGKEGKGEGKGEIQTRADCALSEKVQGERVPFFSISCRSFSKGEFANLDRKKYVACIAFFWETGRENVPHTFLRRVSRL